MTLSDAMDLYFIRNHVILHFPWCVLDTYHKSRSPWKNLISSGLCGDASYYISIHAPRIILVSTLLVHTSTTNLE